MSQADSPHIKIAVVDDHSLFRKGLINLIEQIDPEFKVIAEASHGKELLAQLDEGLVPDIVVLDVNMPVMDGFQTANALRQRQQRPAILALTMLEDEVTLIRLLKAGVNAYLNKDVDPGELRTALKAIADKGRYYPEYVAGKLVDVLRQPPSNSQAHSDLSEKEMEFLELACSEDTYKVIADKMCLSIKTIDGYRAKLFEKLEVKSRVGLVLYALKHNLISMEQLDVR